MQADNSMERDMTDEDMKKLGSLEGFGWFLYLNASKGKKTRISSGAGEKGIISVIIPVYNGERYIEECVTSIWKQEPCGYEVEITAVDDGSKDGSLRLLESLSVRSPLPMKVLRHEGGVNKGVSATRNMGLNHAKGEWICTLDADDAWEPNKLKTQMEYLAANPGVVILCSYGHTVDEKGKPCRGWTGGYIAGDYRLFPEYGFDAPYTLEQMLKGCPVVNSTVIARRQVFVDIGGYKEGLSHQTEDWLMWTQFSIKNPIHLIKEPLIRYRIHPASWTTRYSKENLSPTSEFEFYIGLLYWMFTSDDPYIRDKAHEVYKKKFTLFFMPVARYFKETQDPHRGIPVLRTLWGILLSRWPALRIMLKNRVFLKAARRLGLEKKPL